METKLILKDYFDGDCTVEINDQLDEEGHNIGLEFKYKGRKLTMHEKQGYSQELFYIHKSDLTQLIKYLTQIRDEYVQPF